MNTTPPTSELDAPSKEIASRIALFETWLNTFPGRVRAVIELSSDGPEKRVLICHKKDKRWVLSVQINHTVRQEVFEFFLRDASLEIKIEALHAMPKLVGQMLLNRNGLVARMYEAIEAFDTFAAEMNIKDVREGGAK